MGEVAFVVVAKAPRPGKVKTRLCPPLRHEQAAALYSGFLLDTVEIASCVPGAEVKVVCPGVEDATILKEMLPSTVGYLLQKETGLTAALTGSFEQCLDEGYRKVFCISSDNPTLPPSFLEEGVEALEKSDTVFGPSEDGGYYLVGAKALHPPLFQNITWSVETVMDQTLARVVKARLSTHLLPAWYDLDTGADIFRLLGELERNRGVAPYTRAALDPIKDELDGAF